MAEVAVFKSILPVWQIAGRGKGKPPKGLLAPKGRLWGRAEYARNCHHGCDEAQTWGRPTISPCPQDMGFLFSHEEEERLRL